MKPPPLGPHPTWRRQLQQILWPIWPKLAQLSPKKRAHYLRELYPFTPPWKGGTSWQYKVWRSEIARLEGRTAHKGPQALAAWEAWAKQHR